MARPTTKKELIDTSNMNFAKLLEIIDALSEEELLAEFNFSDNLKLTEAHWSRDKNIKDILIHLYEWHKLLINWITKNKAGQNIPFLPEPYNWKTYSEMNMGFIKKHKSTSYEQAMQMLKNSHNDVMKLIELFSNEELFTKQYFSWSGTTSIGSYCVSSTSSHYVWAIKKIKKHKKKDYGM